MHADEFAIDVPLVRALIDSQCPQWADLPIAAVDSAGTDNAMFRLGDDLVVRMPRIASAAAQIAKEQRWLPGLAPHLPLALPAQLVAGSSNARYPWPWSVCSWLPGADAAATPVADPSQAARDLADFIAALQRIDPTGGPRAGPQNGLRGVPLVGRDRATREAITLLGSTIDGGAAVAAWETALRAPTWDQPPTWIHGDLSPLNVLVEDGRLSAVIDFGALGVGDPACDLMVAWTLLSVEARQVFRDALSVDDATWARGRGWALSVAAIALPYYAHTNPALAAIAGHAIREVLADCR